VLYLLSMLYFVLVFIFTFPLIVYHAFDMIFSLHNNNINNNNNNNNNLQGITLMNDCVLFVFAAATNRPAGRCINCGVLQMNSGLCSCCIDMGQCIVCKRYLPPHSFEEVNVCICQVYRHFCVNSFNQHQFSLSQSHTNSVYLSDH